MDDAKWPELDYQGWKETCQTLHRWIQIVGKIRLSKTAWVNHGWHATLYVTERGLTTSVIHDSKISFAIELDFATHELRILASNGVESDSLLRAESVASFHRRLFERLREAGIEALIHGRPNELPDVLPFAEDEIHCAYDRDSVNRFFRALLQADRLMKSFRSQFIGKVSPVHFFWGGMDLAVTRFSGARAPEHPGGIPNLPDRITREAYSHAVSSCGFWPGNEIFPTAAFYSYAYPEPEGFDRAPVPRGVWYEPTLREFILPYETVRTSRDPDRLVLDFFQKTYEAAADRGGWDRELLEHSAHLERVLRRAA